MLAKRIMTRVTRLLSSGSVDKRSGIPIRPDDVFVVSYPKSGNTWVRFLFANILKQNPEELINFHNVHDYCPPWNKNPELLQQLSSPRIMKSHLRFNPSFPKVIYVVRDGRDVYISYFHYLKKSLPPEWSLKDFMQNYDFPYGSWSDHVKSWLKAKARDKENFKIIRYEDLIKDTLSVFSEMTQFAGFDVGEERLASAVGSCNFVQMQNIERRYGRKYGYDSAEVFVRNGKVGEWKKCFGESEWEIFQSKEDVRLLKKLGFSVSKGVLAHVS